MISIMQKNKSRRVRLRFHWEEMGGGGCSSHYWSRSGGSWRILAARMKVRTQISSKAASGTADQVLNVILFTAVFKFMSFMTCTSVCWLWFWCVDQGLCTERSLRLDDEALGFTLSEYHCDDAHRSRECRTRTRPLQPWTSEYTNT